MVGAAGALGALPALQDEADEQGRRHESGEPHIGFAVVRQGQAGDEDEGRQADPAQADRQQARATPGKDMDHRDPRQQPDGFAGQPGEEERGAADRNRHAVSPDRKSVLHRTGIPCAGSRRFVA